MPVINMLPFRPYLYHLSNLLRCHVSPSHYEHIFSTLHYIGCFAVLRNKIMLIVMNVLIFQY